MPGTAAAAAAAATASAPGAPTSSASATPKKATSTPEKKYKCQFCHRAFSRSEHRSRHERSHTKERPFKCQKCRSTFVRRDLLLRHDRTVHAKDGGAPLVSEVKRRPGAKPTTTTASTAKAPPAKPAMSLDVETATLEQIEASSEGNLDLETAAMLITDFQHKATAQLANQEDPLDEGNASYSPDHTNMFDSSMSFMPSAVPMPQMSWDPFMSNAVNQPKAHSVSSSSLSGSQDSQLSQLSFNSASTLQPSVNQLPPMMERFPSNGDTLAPSLQSLSGNISMSGPGTPSGLSPFPYLGPVSPVDYRRSPGPSQPMTTPKIPQIRSDEDLIRLQENAKRWDREGSSYSNVQIQLREDMNACLESYFKLFHPHLPFLHPESFDPADIPSALLLSVLSIGALYTLNHERAYLFHVGSKNLVNQVLQGDPEFSSRTCPLWTMQSTLLNMIFASWSGDPKGLEWTCSIKSLVAQMVAGNLYELNLRRQARGRDPTHAEWVEDEGCRRTYYAVYVFFGMLTLSFSHTPAINFTEFNDLELPSSESLWNLEVVDEDSWQESFSASPTISVREAYDTLYQGEVVRYSAYATRIMINALFLEVWLNKRNIGALQDVVTEYKLRLALEYWEKSLEVCEPETIMVQLSAPHKGHPLIFNSMAIYRNTRARLEVDLKPVQEALRYHNPYEVATAMTNARELVKRSEEMLKVIDECYSCVEIVAMQGIKWVSRTCATNWSLEHPLCGLELLVILSLWLYRLEHDEEPATAQELDMYNKVRNLFDDEVADARKATLSSTVARLWGGMLDEVVVWGVTKIMGESCKLHADALSGYEDAIHSSASNTPTASGHSVDHNLDRPIEGITA